MPIRDQIEPDVKWILQKLHQNGYDAYLVGGAVRDLLLSITPKDYDISTSATPEQVRKVFGRRRARIIGRRFKLVHLTVGNERYEISTFRREPTEKERKGRQGDGGLMIWRDNEYGTVEEDAFRRDFTVNSMYYDVAGDQGIIDFTGGETDLRKGMVRAIGEADRRLIEDPVRMIRALKLVSQYKFKLEPELKKNLREQAHMIDRSSRARLFEELIKIMNKPHSRDTFEAMHKVGLLQYFWPNMDALWHEADGEFVRKILEVRDAHIKGGEYSYSKTLTISTLCFVHVAGQMLRETEESDRSVRDLWSHQSGLEKICRDCVADFMQPFHVPRFLSARTRDLILMLPRFFDQQSGKRKMLRHPEYKYARQLFMVLADVFNWDADIVKRWPEPQQTRSPRDNENYRYRNNRQRRPSTKKGNNGSKK